uniref:Uncharacterized protein n=1 Tax=Anguilla anguilla TaxID=7936 RepID=A0A0E9SE01_ANGAN
MHTRTCRRMYAHFFYPQTHSRKTCVVILLK